jgi:hypothetical protein
MCAEPKLQECNHGSKQWERCYGRTWRMSRETPKRQRLRAHRRGRTSAPSGVTARRRIRGISQMKGRLRSSANHGSRRRQSRDPARTPLARSHSIATQALGGGKTHRPPHQPPEDILAVMEPVVVLVWDSSQNDRDDLEIHDLGDYISASSGERSKREMQQRIGRAPNRHPIHRECP